MGQNSEANERVAERRRQEDEAPRLRDVVPELLSCRLDIVERRDSMTTADVSHVRHVIVERAPALFIIPCSDSSCRDGGYDISSSLVRGLREHRNPIEGEDTCHGSIGTASCGRVLTYVARAEYSTAAP